MSRIIELFDAAFKCNYPQYRAKSISEGKDFQAIFSEISDYIQNFSISFNVKVEKSVGIGRWSAVPWIRVFYPDTSPSAQDGVYIVYLFSASGKSAFITLNQGTTNSSIEKIRVTKKKIQDNIDNRNFSLSNGKLAIGDNKDYGESIIFYKEYKANSLPSEDEMNNDLRSMLEIYKECRDKGLLSNTISYKENDFIQNEENKIVSDKKEILSNQIKDFHISNFTSNPIHTRYIRSLLAKPFVILSGNSGTGKTRIATRFAEYLKKTNDTGIKNSLLIPVGADWTDNTKILGYYNPLANSGAGEYVKTDVFRFIETAGANPDIPFFLILDEMNLSHVERYFSDFLSKMELLDFRSDKKVFIDIQGYGQLELPKNLFITGTVNIDETTYMFSPKVLDRANVIEFKPGMDDVLSNLLSDTSADEQKPADTGVAEGFMQLANEVRSGKIPAEVSTLLADIQLILKSVYEKLERYGFEFAFRTAKEIRLYAVAAYKTAENGKQPTATEIADIQILQKILPKIHGNRKQIGTLLDELEKICEEKTLSDSLDKIKQMKKKLSSFQYASFI